MEDINIINNEKDNLLVKAHNLSSFDRLCNLQKLVKKESMISDLCK